MQQEDIIRHMVARLKGEESSSKQPLSIQARNLLDIREERLRFNPFKPGDLVMQRRNVARYRYPEPETEVAIVTNVGANFPDKSDDTYSESDMVVMCLASGQWVEFVVESWRFDRYDGEVDAS